MWVITPPCILFVINTDNAEYMKLSEVDSAVESFAKDASNQCEDTAVSIFLGGVGQDRFVLSLSGTESHENHEFFLRA